MKQQIMPRKRPKQSRSNGLVSAVLEAAIRVLKQEGAQRFTTARVAEKAGISVGSLYQYFPNKAAILFQLQSEEWERTALQWRTILRDTGTPPLERLRMLVHVFVRSECEEAAMRMALHDAEPFLRDEPDYPIAEAQEESALETFLREILPRTPDASRRQAADLIEATLTEVGQCFSEQVRTPAETEAYADAMADMFSAYIRSLEQS